MAERHDASSDVLPLPSHSRPARRPDQPCLQLESQGKRTQAASISASRWLPRHGQLACGDAELRERN